MTHLRTALVPGATSVTVVVGELTFTIVAEPEISCHDPVPVAGMFADIKKVLLLHCSTMAGPASATSGNALLVRTTWSVFGAQVPFSTRHSKVTEEPAATPVTVVLYAEGFVIVALPDMILQVPEPIAGSVAAMVKAPSLHCSWSMPATAAEGSGWWVSTISEVLSAHTPLSIV